MCLKVIISVYLNVHLSMYTDISMCTHVSHKYEGYLFICLHIYMLISVYMTLFAYVHVCICMYAYIYIYVHTYAHMRKSVTLAIYIVFFCFLHNCPLLISLYIILQQFSFNICRFF